MDPLLFGHNSEEHIVAVQHISDDKMRMHVRTIDGVRPTDADFFPFLFLSDPSYLEGFYSKYWIKELAGNNYFRFLAAFSRWSEMWDAVHQIIDRYNERTKNHVENYNEVPVLHLRADAVSQFLMQSGRTLFKGMEFNDLYRMQLDIETYSKQGFKYSNANRPEDRIIVITLSDNRGWDYILHGKQKTEPQILAELINIITEKDPDVLEGHNIYGFDLPYILKRCELHNIEFNIGRDGSPPRSFDSRSTFAERSIDYVSYEIGGRHIIDTYFLVQAYDVSKRTLESYGLKYVAQHFGFASDKRIYIQGDRISWYWDNEPDLLLRYALDDIHETRQLSEFLSPSTFYLTQMVPYNYGTLARIGSSAKIESLILREYIRHKYSVSKPETGLQTTGGYTDIFTTGILYPIIHIDVESLYPSIMLTKKIAPKNDSLKIFLSLLDHLTKLRLDTKKKIKTAKSTAESTTLDAMQASLKILINSFYGYLGYTRALFNDIAAADAVTTTGQDILRELIGTITKLKGTVVEVDTDGILFVPPAMVQNEQQEEEFARLVSKSLPPGINLRIDGRYSKMLSYKKKNYALLGYDNRLTMKGSSLISRNIEKFGKFYIQQCIDGLLNSNIDGLHRLYANIHRDISEHKLAVTDFAKTETLKENLERYSNEVSMGQRNRAAAYEAALSSGRQWRSGDRITYYITGMETTVKGFEHCKLAEEWDPNFPDENTAHYLRRLDEFSKKFEMFFSAKDFRAIFSVDDLFPFSPAGINIITTPVEKEIIQEKEETEDIQRHELTILLDDE